VSGAHDPEAARRAAREAELKRRANDAEALSRQAEDLARRLNRRLDEAESELGRLRGTIIDRETEIAGLIVRCDILADAQERLLRSEAQFSRVSSELMAFRAEQDDLIAHARSQAAAQAVLQFCQLASAPMATLRQLESSLPAGQREVLGACLAQLEISMRPPGG
jgi:chromosome segregation ATPase